MLSTSSTSTRYRPPPTHWRLCQRLYYFYQIQTSSNTLKIVSEVVLLLPDTDLLQHIEDCVRGCTTSTRYRPPPTHWRLCQRLYYFYQIQTSSNTLKIVSEVVLLLPDTDLLQHIEDCVRGCTTSTRYRPPPTHWRLCQRLYYFYQIQTSSNTLKIVSEVVLLLPDTDLLQHIEDCVRGCTTSTRYRPPPTHWRLCQRLYYFYQIQTSSNTLKIVSEVVLLLPDTDLLQHIEDCVRGCTTSTRYRPPPTHWRLCQRLYYFYQIQTSSNTLKIVSEVVLLLPDTDLLQHIEDCVRGCTTSTRYRPPPTHWRLCQRLYYFYQIQTSSNTLKIVSEVVLLLPDTDLLQHIEDCVRGCTTSTRYRPPPTHWRLCQRLYYFYQIQTSSNTLKIVSEVVLLLPDTDLLQHIEDCVRGCTTSTRYRPPPTHWRLCQRLYYFYQIQISSNTLKIVSEVVLLLPDTDLLQHIEDCVRGCTTSTRYRPPPTHWRLCQRLYYFYQIQTSSNTLKIVSEVVLLLPDTDLLQHIEDCVRGCTTSTRYRPPPTHWRLCQRLYYFYPIQTSSNTLKIVSEVVLLLPDTDLLQHIEDCVRGCTTSTRYRPPPTHWRLCQRLYYFYQIQTSSNTLKIVSEVVLLLPDTDLLQHIEDCVRGCTTSTRYRPPPTHWRLCQRLYYFYQIQTSSNTLKIVSEVVLLLPDTDLLQHIEDCVRGCTTSTRYRPPPTHWRLCQRLYYFYPIQTSSNTLKIVSEVVLLLPDTDLLQHIEDCVRGCTTSTRYRPPPTHWRLCQRLYYFYPIQTSSNTLKIVSEVVLLLPDTDPPTHWRLCQRLYYFYQIQTSSNTLKIVSEVVLLLPDTDLLQHIEDCVRGCTTSTRYRPPPTHWRLCQRLYYFYQIQTSSNTLKIVSEVVLLLPDTDLLQHIEDCVRGCTTSTRYRPPPTHWRLCQRLYYFYQIQTSSNTLKIVSEVVLLLPDTDLLQHIEDCVRGCTTSTRYRPPPTHWRLCQRLYYFYQIQTSSNTLKIVSEVVLLLPDTDLLQHIEDCVRGCTTSTRYRPPPTHWRLCQRLYYFYQIQTSSNTLKIVSEVVLLLPDTDLLQHIEDCVRGCTTSTRYRPPPTHWRLCQRLYYFYQIQTSSNTLKIVSEVVLLLPDTDLLQHIEDCVRGCTTSTRYRPPPTHWRLCQRLYYFYQIQTSSNTLKIVSEVVLLLPDTDLLQHIEDCVRGCTTSTRYRPPPTHWRLCQRLYYFYQIQTSSNTLKIVSEVVLLLPDTDLLQHIEDCVRGCTTSTRYRPPPTHWRLCQRLYYFYQIQTSSNTLKIVSEVVLLLPDTDLLQHIEDCVRGCTTSTRYRPPPTHWRLCQRLYYFYQIQTHWRLCQRLYSDTDRLQHIEDCVRGCTTSTRYRPPPTHWRLCQRLYYFYQIQTSSNTLKIVSEVVLLLPDTDLLQHIEDCVRGCTTSTRYRPPPTHWRLCQRLYYFYQIQTSSNTLKIVSEVVLLLPDTDLLQHIEDCVRGCTTSTRYRPPPTHWRLCQRLYYFYQIQTSSNTLKIVSEVVLLLPDTDLLQHIEDCVRGCTTSTRYRPPPTHWRLCQRLYYFYQIQTSSNTLKIVSEVVLLLPDTDLLQHIEDCVRGCTTSTRYRPPPTHWRLCQRLYYFYQIQTSSNTLKIVSEVVLLLPDTDLLQHIEDCVRGCTTSTRYRPPPTHWRLCQRLYYFYQIQTSSNTLKIVSEVVLLLPDTDLLQHIEDCVRGCTTSTRYRPPPTHWRLCQRLYYFYQIQTSSNTLKIVSEVVLLLPDTDLLQHIEDCVRGCTTSTRYRPPPTHWRLCQRLYYFYQIQTSSNTLKIVSEVVLLLPDTDLLQHIEDCVRGCTTSTRYRPPPTHWRLCQRLYYFYQIQTSSNTLKIVSEVVLLLPDTDLLQHIEDCVRGCTTSTRYRPPPTHWRLCQRLYYFYQIQTSSNTLKIVSEVVLLLPDTDLLQHIEDCVRGCTTSTRYRPPPTHWRLCQRLYYFYQIQTSSNTLKIVSEVVLLLPDTDLLQHIEDCVRGCTTSTRYRPPPTHWRLCQRLYYFYQIQTSSNTLKIVSEVVLLLPDTDLLQHIEDCVRGCTTSTRYRPPPTHWRLCQRLYYFYQIQTSSNTLKIVSEVVLLLPDTDLLQHIEDCVRGCTTSTRYRPPPTHWRLCQRLYYFYQIQTASNTLKIVSEVVLLLPDTDRLQHIEDCVRGCTTSTRYRPPPTHWRLCQRLYYFYQIQTASNTLKIVSEVAHDNWKWLKLFPDNIELILLKYDTKLRF